MVCTRIRDTESNYLINFIILDILTRMYCNCCGWFGNKQLDTILSMTPVFPFSASASLQTTSTLVICLTPFVIVVLVVSEK